MAAIIRRFALSLFTSLLMLACAAAEPTQALAVDEAKANGTVKAAIDRVNLRVATIPSGRGGR